MGHGKKGGGLVVGRGDDIIHKLCDSSVAQVCKLLRLQLPLAFAVYHMSVKQLHPNPVWFGTSNAGTG